MSSVLDPRLIEITITVPDKTYSFSGDYYITASGTKFGCGTMNTCKVRIDNLTRQDQNALLTLASPLLNAPDNNPSFANTNNPKGRVIPFLTLNVGRKSLGTFTLFNGMVWSCEMTQPPDIGLVFTSLTNNQETAAMANIQQSENAPLSEICNFIAQQMQLFLAFEATDKIINNYSFTGANQWNIDKLNQMGGIQAGVDNGTLWVINAGAVRKNTGFLINDANGLVGIPQVTSEGVIARVMINSAIQIAGQVRIESVMNPAANGTFKVVKMDYEIASREPPFWYTLLCSNYALYQGSVAS